MGSSARLPSNSQRAILSIVLSGAIEVVTGAAPTPDALHSESDIRTPININGTPAVGFGPLGGGLTHAALTDECIDLDRYRRAMKAVVVIMVDWTRDAHWIIGKPIQKLLRHHHITPHQ